MPIAIAILFLLLLILQFVGCADMHCTLRHVLAATALASPGLLF